MSQFGPVMSCMTLSGSVKFGMVLYVTACTCVVLFSLAWSCLVLLDCFLVCYDFIWSSLILYMNMYDHVDPICSCILLLGPLG